MVRLGTHKKVGSKKRKKSWVTIDDPSNYAYFLVSCVYAQGREKPSRKLKQPKSSGRFPQENREGRFCNHGIDLPAQSVGGWTSYVVIE